MRSIHERLRAARGETKLRDFAELLRDKGGFETTHTSIRNYEQGVGRKAVPVGYVQAVAKVTGIRVQWLMDGAGPVYEDDEVTGKVQKLLEAFRAFAEQIKQLESYPVRGESDR